MPNQIKEIDFYDDKYFHKEYNRYKKRSRFVRHRLKKIFDIYFPKKHEKVLDIGCSIGIITHELTKKGIKGPICIRVVMFALSNFSIVFILCMRLEELGSSFRMISSE